MKQFTVLVAIAFAIAAWTVPASASSDNRYARWASIWVPDSGLLPADYPAALRAPEPAKAEHVRKPAPQPAPRIRRKPAPEPRPEPEPELEPGWQAEPEGPAFSFLDRLEIGTRVNYFFLLDDSRDITESFLGSITVLEEEQNYYPAEFFASFDITDWLAIEAGYDVIMAKAVTENDKHSDGIFIYEGPTASLVGRMANDTAFTPFVSIGAAIMNGRMKHNPVWHYGFKGTPEEKEAAYEAWRAAGSPPNPNNGNTRTLDPKDAIGMLLGAGFDIEFTDNFTMQVTAGYMGLSADTHYYLSQKGKVIDDRGNTSFPLDNVSVGVGVKYCF